MPDKFKNVNWPFLIITGLGMFVGTFWLFFGFLIILGHTASWWQYGLTLLPGGGIIFLVIMARKNPLPYGTGLVVLGILPLLMWHFASAWRLRFWFGIPLLLIGLGFIVWRKHALDSTSGYLHG